MLPILTYVVACELQNPPEDQKINYKTKRLLETLSSQCIQPALLMKPIQSSLWGYRRKARLIVKYVIKIKF